MAPSIVTGYDAQRLPCVQHVQHDWWDAAHLYICPPHLYTVATLPWEIKKSFFNSIIRTYFRLFALSQKKTNCYSLTHHTWKMSPHYLVKCANSSFSFSLLSTWIPIHDMDELRKHLVTTWAEFQQSVVDDAVEQWRKKTGSIYPCKKWSLEHLL